ncbi:ABC transporter ATP-binding protein, partial [bacterium]|nr:ABC transporter ATP-binding protein [bacterium]
TKTVPKPVTKGVRKKLSFKEKYELEHMEDTIHKAEAELSHIKEKIQDPKVIANPIEMKALCEKLNGLQEKVDKLYVRWDELENIVS